VGKNHSEENVTDFWDIAPRNAVETDRRFRNVYCLHTYVMMEAISILKVRLTSARLHGAVYQKAVVFAAVKT
jgi:hypothetical protein